MGNGYILKEESDRMLTEQAVRYAQSEILMQMRRELNDARNCVTAMVLSNGGEIRVDDSVLYSLKDYELESYRDEKHRCFVFQAVSRK